MAGTDWAEIFASPFKRSIFISYHHQGDQAYYDALVKAFSSSYQLLRDNSVDRIVQSDNVDYIIQQIRDNTGSSCTLVLCGAETPWRKYVDWEIKATLDKEHGLIGVNLPSNPANANGRATVPDRLYDNIQARYAIWTNWAAITANLQTPPALIEQANKTPRSLIKNQRPMMSRNGTPPWRT